MNLTPNVDSLAEITVQTNTYTVDYGRASSLQTVMTTRSGTEQYPRIRQRLLHLRGPAGVGRIRRAPAKHAGAVPHQQHVVWRSAARSFRTAQVLLLLRLRTVSVAVPRTASSCRPMKIRRSSPSRRPLEPNSPEVQLLTKYPPSNATFRERPTNCAAGIWRSRICAADTGCVTPSTDNIPCSTPVFDSGQLQLVQLQQLEAVQHPHR